MLRIFSSLLLVISVATVSEAQLYFVHGVDGREVGTSLANSYDVLINGNCLIKGINYQQISAPVGTAAGRYEMEVRTANGSCTGTLNVAGSYQVALNESFSVVAHLNEQGVPTVTKFSNDPRNTAGAKARLVIRHTAGVEPITVRLRRLTKGSSQTFGGYLPIIDSGDQQALELQAGTYAATFYSTVGYKQKLASSEVTLANDKFMAVYPVGSFKGKTFAVIVQNLDTVK